MNVTFRTLASFESGDQRRNSRKVDESREINRERDSEKISAQHTGKNGLERRYQRSGRHGDLDGRLPEVKGRVAVNRGMQKLTLKVEDKECRTGEHTCTRSRSVEGRDHVKTLLDKIGLGKGGSMEGERNH